MNYRDGPDVCSRTGQRRVMEQERRERKTGNWSPWRPVEYQQLAALRGQCHGWATEFTAGWRNGWCVVLIRPVHSALGPVHQLMITTASGTELSWRERQRVKDELMGRDRMAVEVMPQAADLAAGTDSYHLWVFEAGYRFDFGLNREGGQR